MQELSDEDVFGAQKEFSDAEIFGSAAQPNTQPNTSGVGFVPQAIMGMNEVCDVRHRVVSKPT